MRSLSPVTCPIMYMKQVWENKANMHWEVEKRNKVWETFLSTFVVVLQALPAAPLSLSDWGDALRIFLLKSPTKITKWMWKVQSYNYFFFLFPSDLYSCLVSLSFLILPFPGIIPNPADWGKIKFSATVYHASTLSPKLCLDAKQEFCGMGTFTVWKKILDLQTLGITTKISTCTHPAMALRYESQTQEQLSTRQVTHFTKGQGRSINTSKSSIIKSYVSQL